MSYKLSAEESAAIDVELGLRKRHLGRPVLVVEDNPLNREITQLLLSKAGLKADAVDSGPAAVAQAACEAYSLIVMDIAMPGMDGVEAARQIRALPGYDQTPIVALTACVFGQDRDYCLSGGLDDFLTKPVTVPRLYRTLLHWLDVGQGYELPRPRQVL